MSKLIMKGLFGLNYILSIFLLLNCSSENRFNNWKGEEVFESKYGKPDFKYNEINGGILMPEFSVGNVTIAPIYNEKYSSEMSFDDLTPEHKILYDTVFADPNVMEFFAAGKIFTKEEFLNVRIKRQNER